jgi:hypothetical protein
MDVPPGWYASGIPGEERWWSGVEWTEFTRPIGGVKKKGIEPGGTFVGSLVAGIVLTPLVASMWVAALLLGLANPLQGFAASIIALGGTALDGLAFYNAYLLSKRDKERAARTAAALNQVEGAPPTPGQRV